MIAKLISSLYEKYKYLAYMNKILKLEFTCLPQYKILKTN